MPDLSFSALALHDLQLEIAIEMLQCSRTRQAQRRGHQPDQQKCCGDRGQGGDRFDRPGEPVDRLPDGPDLHQVGRPAGDDEDCEAHENPVELQVFTATDEIQQGEGNREIGERDQRIGYDVQRQDVGAPLKTHAMRHKTGRGEHAIEIIRH